MANKECFLIGISVKKSYQRTGLGTHLVKLFIKYAIYHKNIYMSFFTVNDNSIGFYNQFKPKQEHTNLDKKWYKVFLKNINTKQGLLKNFSIQKEENTFSISDEIPRKYIDKTPIFLSISTFLGKQVAYLKGLV